LICVRFSSKFVTCTAVTDAYAFDATFGCGNEQSVPCAFLELIERHEGFRGFLGQNAKGIFESTKMRR
jgi:hypothetical protein